MRRPSWLAGWLAGWVVVVACASPDPRAQELARLKAQLADRDPNERKDAYSTLMPLCCPIGGEGMLFGPAYVPACKVLGAAPADDPVVETVILAVWIPACYEHIPIAWLLAALESRAVREQPKVELAILRHLANYEPTIDAIRVLMEYPASGDLRSDERYWARINWLAHLGEPDLAIVMGAMLEHDNREVRRNAATAIHAAVRLPLEIAGLEPALARMAQDRDPEIAWRAASALDTVRYLRQNPRPLDALIAHEMLDTLGRRRFACGVPEVELKLQLAATAVSSSSNWMEGHQARVLLKHRARYCGASKVAPP